MLRIHNIKIRENMSDEKLIDFVLHKYHIHPSDMLEWNIFKKSIDARKKNDIFFNYTIDIQVKDESKYSNLQKVEIPDIEKDIKNRIQIVFLNSLKTCPSPIIVGAGPAGLFSALTLVQHGITPIIIEQGKTVDDRKQDVNCFLHDKQSNPFSNVQFVEAGAGTFSDGNLTTGILNSLCQ